jgi:hypothetical protein
LICNDLIGLNCFSNACACNDPSYYFDSAQNNCVKKLNYNAVGCPTSPCDDTLGLTCSSGTCACVGATNIMWSVNKCDYFTIYSVKNSAGFNVRFSVSYTLNGVSNTLSQASYAGVTGN